MDEKEFYRLAAERAYDPDRYAQMNVAVSKVARDRNEFRKERHRKESLKWWRSEKGKAANKRRRERIKSDPVLLEKHRKQNREYQKKRYHENPEKIAERNRTYYLKYREKILERKMKMYREMTTEERNEFRAKRRESYRRNREKVLEYERNRYRMKKEKK